MAATSLYQHSDMDFVESTEGQSEEHNDQNDQNEQNGDQSNQNSENEVIDKGGWRCTKCDNMNYAYRDKCNMRKCKAPRGDTGTRRDPCRTDEGKDQDPKRSRQMREGDWICKKCGNVNFATRVRCNMRKCQAPREEWVCPVCKNVNYKFRTHCNMRKCQAARPPETYPDFPNFHRGYGSPGFGMLSSPMGEGFGFPSQPSSIGHNQNYPQLQALLSQGSLTPRMMHPGGYGYPHRRDIRDLHRDDMVRSPQRNRGNDGFPREKREGDWQCRECGNINFANRQTCNMRKCGAEKPPPM